MSKTITHCVKFLCDIDCQKLLKSANVSRNYSKKWKWPGFLKHNVYAIIVNFSKELFADGVTSSIAVLHKLTDCSARRRRRRRS